MSSGDLCVKFVSKKVNKVRWRPQPKIPMDDENCGVFAVGSWDDEENTLSIWQNPNKNQTSMDDFNELEDPQLITEIPHSGDVTGIEFLSTDWIVSSSSLGSVHLYRYEQQNLKQQCCWEKIHSFPQHSASCTSIATLGDDVVSVGEDCRMIRLNVNKRKPAKIIDEADSCSLTSVSFLRHQEVVTGNMRGYLKLWDFRTPRNKPSRILLIAGGQSAVSCMNQHPTQLHTLASGGDDGGLCIWDLRQEQQPVTLLSAHTMAMTEVKFHPTNPDHLFTCSQDGSAWHWNAAILKLAPTGGKVLKVTETESSIQNPWLNCDTSKHRLEIVSLLQYSTLPVNSLDIQDNVLLCGSDNEAVYVIKGFSF